MLKKLKYCLFLIFMSATAVSFGSHLLGDVITYKVLGVNQYEITITLVRDCKNSSTPFDPTLNYTIFNADNTKFSDRAIPRVLANEDEPPATDGDPCVVPPPDLCIKRIQYRDTVTLTPSMNGYYVTYQRGNWAASLTNIINPGDEGMTLTCQIPGTNSSLANNNGAVFNDFPPLILCLDKDFEFDHSATDPDGDSIVYSFCDPDRFVSGGNPQPASSQPAPYQPIPWEAGYDAFTAFGAGATYTLDSTTGYLNITPTMIGNFLTGICAFEYRNGVLLNTTKRVFNYGVVSCSSIIPFSFETNDSLGLFPGNPSGQKILSEDCGEQSVFFQRDTDTSEIIIEIRVLGTAINGVDFPFIGDTLLMPIGVKDTTLRVTAFLDPFVEPSETIQLIFKYFDICDGEYDSLVVDMIILDYQPLSVSIPVDSVNVCPDFGEIAKLNAVPENGIGPYSYQWISKELETYPDVSLLTIPNQDIPEVQNPYYVVIKDQCQKVDTSNIAIVYNQCPIIVPNVVTVNGDQINDVFVIKNLQDYPAVKLKIFNRWGQLLYQNDDYKNDWIVTYNDGTFLTEGVYFYFAEVVDDIKYEYDDQETTLYQAQGFFHVIR